MFDTTPERDQAPIEEQISKLDWLAQQIVRVFQEREFDAAYIEGTVILLKDEDRLGAARYICDLDRVNQHFLAKKIGVTPSDLESFLKVLRHI